MPVDPAIVLDYAMRTVWALIVVLVALLLARAVRRITMRALTRNRAQANVTILLGNLAQVAVITVGVLVVLAIYTRDAFGWILTSFSVLGIVLGLSLQDILKNFLAGIWVLVERPFRIGDAIEVTAAIRDLVRERGALLYYYATGQKVEMRNAIDQAMAFIVGTSHQVELESIRSRVAEALRARVRSGRLAGGRCYGYHNIQNPDPDGRRKNTTAVIDPEQADVVRRIFALYAAGRGLGAIAKQLNRERVPQPSAGRRGTGSWAPSAVRAMLRNERYTGVYIHGRFDRKREGGKRMTSKADPSTVIRVEVPAWRIIDDATWQTVQARFAAQAGTFGDSDLSGHRRPIP